MIHQACASCTVNLALTYWRGAKGLTRNRGSRGGDHPDSNLDRRTGWAQEPLAMAQEFA